MRDILADIARWRADGKRVAIATNVRAYASALRPLGAKMACTSTGDISGSVSGGCIEGAVYEVAQEVMASGRPRLLEYGVPDASAWEIGLACGGTIQIWVEELARPFHETLARCMQLAQPVAQATVIAGPGMGERALIWPDGRIQGVLQSAVLTGQIRRYAIERLSSQNPGRRSFEVDGERAEVFVEVFAPSPRLIVVGAVHIAIPLVTIAKVLGFRTTVIDPRAAFATPERFPHADELIVEWPSQALTRLGLDAATCVVVVTHDDKLDVPALRVATAGPVRYVGILGSSRTHAKRIRALTELGVTTKQLDRIHAPIGLRMGAIGPDEIALSIMAEIVAVSRGVDTGLATSLAARV